MITFLLIVHVLVCLALIAIVLLQGGKGADMGAMLGGGSSHTVFGAGGGASFMGKLTAGVATLFMLTSLSLAFLYAQPGADSIMPSEVAVPVQQQQTTPADQPADQPEDAAPAASVPAEQPAAPAN
jgi:preprotein translocase subunit SecG